MLPLGFYRTLLWCYPASFRREYGTEMVSAFAEQVQEAREHGGWWAEASIWLHTLLDLLLTVPQEHSHVMRQDLRYAIRTLASNPGFTAVAILSLALGIGANTAIFSLLNSIRLSALPVSNPHELVMLTNPGTSGLGIGSSRGERSLLTYPEFEQLRDQSTSFSGLMASQSSLNRVQARVDGGEPEEIRTRMVSAEYFTTLGVAAVLGRTFGEEARAEGTAPYAVISYNYWRRRFGGRPDILGATMAIRGGLFSIIGVAPASFFGETVGQRPDAWLPLSMQATVLPGRDWLRDQPGNVEKVMWLHVFGRLEPGVTIETAQAGANVLFQQGLAAYYGSAPTPEAQKEFLDQRLKLRPAATGASQIRGQFSEPLLMLLAAAGIVLLIACANLGNLLLARATARNREISVRLALGASRGRLIRQLLTESMVLALLGGIVGLGAAFLIRTGLLRLVPDSIELPGAPDVRVLAFAFALTLAAGLVLGLLPALRTTRTNAATGLKEQGRGLTGSTVWLRVSKFVVIGQLALSLPLLVGAGLLLRTLSNLQRAHLGYPKERVLLVRVDAQTAGYEESRRPALFGQLLDRIQAVPGVRATTYSKNGLFSGSDSGDQVIVEGYARQGNNDRGSAYDHVGPNYFSTLGIPVLLGREITEDDQPSSQKVCVINEAFAKLFFEGRNPLGMHVTQVYGNQRNTYQIVGVARDSRAHRIRGEIEHRFYVPVTQPVTMPNEVSLAIRTAAAPSNVIAGVRRALLRIDSTLPITARPLTELVDEQMVQERLLARLSIAFGVVGLLLAAIGLYGVLSYGVARRTNEIGIRKALGAQHGALIAMILRETGALLAVGLVAGIALSAATIRLITSRLYGLEPTDPVTFVAAIAVLSGVALVATWLPAHRASRVDPLVALRHE
ncbi:MAG: FtsX-like permease family protein [Luteitalea sp.]|nr:FtsX-like permease family protein [Luteitalea sp.]